MRMGWHRIAVVAPGSGILRLQRYKNKKQQLYLAGGCADHVLLYMPERRAFGAPPGWLTDPE